MFYLSHAAADRHPRPDTRDGMCPLGHSGWRTPRKPRACVHARAMHTFSISTIDTFFATGIFGRRSSRITDRRFQLLPDITDGPLPMVQHGTVAVLQNSFGPTAYEQIVRAPNDGNGWASSREPGPRENRWAERDLPGSANGFSARFFLVSVGTSDLVSFSHAGTSDVGAVRTRKRFPIPSG